MKTFVFSVAAAAMMIAAPAFAALKVGDAPPPFKAQIADNGKVGDYSLKRALRSGPVVVYFYPKSFTGGCDLEAHEYSEAVDKLKTKNVTVIGISTDDIDTQQKFSTAKCAGKFPVAADPKAIITSAYAAKMTGVKVANRISYIVGKDGKIAFVHEDGNASTHVPAVLAAVDAMK